MRDPEKTKETKRWYIAVFVKALALSWLCSNSCSVFWFAICSSCFWKLFQLDEYVVFIDLRLLRTISYSGMNCFNYFNCRRGNSKWARNFCLDCTIEQREVAHYSGTYEQANTSISEVIWRQSSKRDFSFFSLSFLHWVCFDSRNCYGRCQDDENCLRIFSDMRKKSFL